MSDERIHLINGRWQAGKGERFRSTDPATGEPAWSGRAANEEEVDAAMAAARRAFEAWADTDLEQRVAVLQRYADVVKANREPLAEAIWRETGKPRWESRSEADLLVAKVGISVDALRTRQAVRSVEVPSGTGYTRYKPHGVVAVFGPFNLPAHLPNGHIVPALLAGNAVVFKPSERTPLVGQKMGELFVEAGLPDGLVNVVQGGRETGQALIKHPRLDGLFFTGSFAGGRAIHRALADRPDKILALEMGGNNPLIVWEAKDLDAAAYHAVVSAYITAGQRCTCARRLILPDNGSTPALLAKLRDRIERLRVGVPDDEPEPFYGPLIDADAADRMLDAQKDLASRDGDVLIEMKQDPHGTGCRALLSPGLIDVTEVDDRPDEEWFGPMLQVVRVSDFGAALAEANRTAYGLAAALLSDNESRWKQFYHKVRAGIVNWNGPTTGASSKLPFGGVGKSGNHRPSAYFAADYCAFPVASMENPTLSPPAKPMPGLDG